MNVNSEPQGAAQLVRGHVSWSRGH